MAAGGQYIGVARDERGNLENGQDNAGPTKRHWMSNGIHYNDDMGLVLVHYRFLILSVLIQFMRRAPFLPIPRLSVTSYHTYRLASRRVYVYLSIVWDCLPSPPPPPSLRPLPLTCMLCLRVFLLRKVRYLSIYACHLGALWWLWK